MFRTKKNKIELTYVANTQDKDLNTRSVLIKALCAYRDALIVGGENHDWTKPNELVLIQTAIGDVQKFVHYE